MPRLGWRLPVALFLFGIAVACPLVGTAILSGDFSTTAKTFAALMFFPIPEIFDLSAIAILGKPGFEWLKAKFRGLLVRFAPSDEVSRTRYRIGLVMFTAPILFGWLHPYLPGLSAAFEDFRLTYNLAGDLVFIASFFVLGGDFWDKIRALFVHGAKAAFPTTKLAGVRGPANQRD